MTDSNSAPDHHDPLWKHTLYKVRRALVCCKRSALHRPKAWITASLVVIALLAGGVVAQSKIYSDPEQLVADYMTAVQQREVKKAHGIAGKPSDEIDDRFLTAEAIDPNWTVESVSEVRETEVATYVETVIAHDSGKTASHRFGLKYHDSDEEWLLHGNAYGYVDLVANPFEVVEINGQREKAVENNQRRVALFPGFYDFFPTASEYVDIAASGYPVMPGEEEIALAGRDRADDPLPLELTKQGAKTAQQLVDDRVDECVDDGEETKPGCPFGMLFLPEENGDIDTLDWEVEQYPEVTVVDKKQVLEFVDRRRGVITASGTALRDDGSEFTFDMSCQIVTNTLVFDVTGESASLALDPGLQQLVDDETDPSDTWSTCWLFHRGGRYVYLCGAGI